MELIPILLQATPTVACFAILYVEVRHIRKDLDALKADQNDALNSVKGDLRMANGRIADHLTDHARKEV
jgi:hypothetical protein